MLAQPGLKGIVRLKQNPCGGIAIGFQPYPNETATGAITFPVCKHGGWQECGLRSQTLCALNITGDPFAMAALVDCHFRNGSAAGAGAMNPTIGSTCASLLGMDYRKLFACAFEGQYPEPYVKGLLLAAFQKSNRPKCQIGSTMFLDGEETIAWTSSAKLLGASCAAIRFNTGRVSMQDESQASNHPHKPRTHSAVP